MVVSAGQCDEEKGMRLRDKGERTVFVPRTSCVDPSVVILLRRDDFHSATLKRVLEALGGSNRKLDQLDRHIYQLQKREEGAYDWGRHSISECWGWPGLQTFFELPVHPLEGLEVSGEWTLDVFNPGNRECRFPFHDPSLVGLNISVDMNIAGLPYRGFFEFSLLGNGVLQGLLARLLEAVSPVFGFGWGVNLFACAFYYAATPPPKEATFKDYFWRRALYTKDDWVGQGLEERWGVQWDEIEVSSFLDPTSLRRMTLPGGYTFLSTGGSDAEDRRACASRLGLIPNVWKLKRIPLVCNSPE